MNPEQQLAFEKARFNYCKDLFSQEVTRKELVEKKAQFYLTFITLFLGAVFLNLESLINFVTKISAQEKLPIWMLYTPLVILWISLFAALFAVLQSMRLREWKGGHPPNLITCLFSPSSKYLNQTSEDAFLKATSLEYILAWEHNRSVNIAKAKWVKRSSLAIFFAVFAIFALIGIVAYAFVTS